MSTLALASAPVTRLASGRYAASTGRACPPRVHLAPRARPRRERRRRWRQFVNAAVDPDDVDHPGQDRDDYADWKAAKDDMSEAFKRAAAQAGEATGITRQVSAASKFASALQDVVAQDLGVAAKRRK